MREHNVYSYATWAGSKSPDAIIQYTRESVARTAIDFKLYISFVLLLVLLLHTGIVLVSSTKWHSLSFPEKEKKRIRSKPYSLWERSNPTEKRKWGFPHFLFDVEDCVADRLLGIATERLLRVTGVALDHDGLAPRTLPFDEVEELFGGKAVEEFLVELGEGGFFFFGEAVERATEEDTSTDTGRNIGAVPLTFEVSVLAVGVLTVALGIEPTVFDGEVAREDEFGTRVRAGRALGIRVGEFGLVGTGLAKNPLNGVSHNR